MQPKTETQPEIRITILAERDREELGRLAQRDSAEIPPGLSLGAEIGGRLVAARSLATGAVIADPFMPTAEVQALLARRAAELGSGADSHRGLLRLFGRRGRRSRGALPASPPGAGGRLLTLPRRAP